MVKPFKSIARYREYVVLLAYGIVIGDMLELVKEVVTEWLMHKRFNQLVQRHIDETTEQEENSVEQTSEFENVKNDVTTVSKRNDSYKEDDKFEKLVCRELALQADLEHTSPETI